MKRTTLIYTHAGNGTLVSLDVPRDEVEPVASFRITKEGAKALGRLIKGSIAPYYLTKTYDPDAEET